MLIYFIYTWYPGMLIYVSYILRSIFYTLYVNIYYTSYEEFYKIFKTVREWLSLELTRVAGHL